MRIHTWITWGKNADDFATEPWEMSIASRRLYRAWWRPTWRKYAKGDGWRSWNFAWLCGEVSVRHCAPAWYAKIRAESDARRAVNELVGADTYEDRL